MIWLKVAVAGRGAPLHFLLDSGAGASVVDLATARRLGLKLGERQTAIGASGRADCYRVDGFDARVEGVPVATTLLALDLSGPSRSCCRHIDGLIGADFFRDHIVRIDFAAETIQLLERSELNSSGCQVLPLTQRNDTLCARVSVDGNAPDWLRLDTGCSTTLEWVVNGDEAKKRGLTNAGANAAAVREVQTGVQIGALRVAAVKTGLHTKALFAGESGLIGNGLLSRFTVTIDAARHCCLLASR